MVDVGTTTMAQRHLAQRQKIALGQRRFDNNILTMLAMLEVKIFVLWFSEGALVFQMSNTKLVLQLVFKLNVPIK